MSQQVFKPERVGEGGGGNGGGRAVQARTTSMSEVSAGPLLKQSNMVFAQMCGSKAGRPNFLYHLW